ncbi:hypothetical protein RXV94_13495 [Yeosuana sp. MJ-SS3]|uniref:Uncharacterized protein n=1 Tax=Gilvirhabdus luticola TaxID=3079858 RepID=A0ABU3U9V1_9FLAO|nr:hypothetical protein [Yeosuana sp. MJ-SS3]MDU8887180.1 hypothetical protein [Yeosuana sp. MJ-SS3]
MNFTPFPELKTDRLMLGQLQKEDLKGIVFLRSDYYNENTIGRIVLIDDEGQVLLDKTETTYYYNDWWEAYYFNTVNPNITIYNNKVYTLVISFNQNLPLLFKTPTDNTNISFPVEWGYLNILETSYKDIEGEIQTNKALFFMEIGLATI